MKNLSNFFIKYLAVFVVALVLLLLSLFIIFGHKNQDGTITFDGKDPTYTETQKQALCELKKESDESVAALTGINVPQDASSDCTPPDLAQMGALVYYPVSMATPQQFTNSVIGKGFNEGYGLQCVAAFKEFMFSLSGKYVATSNGGASGYAKQQAQIEPLGFKWYSGTSGLRDGDWAIWTNGQYGHVAMKLGDKWLSQNQYAANPNTGNAFSLASISSNGIAGYYRPNIYIQAAPTPEPTPQPEENTGTTGNNTTNNSYTVKRGDTLGKISLSQGWYIGTKGLYGNSGYTQRLADFNNIQNRGIIYPNQVIKRVE